MNVYPDVRFVPRFVGETDIAAVDANDISIGAARIGEGKFVLDNRTRRIGDTVNCDGFRKRLRAVLFDMSVVEGAIIV